MLAEGICQSHVATNQTQGLKAHEHSRSGPQKVQHHLLGFRHQNPQDSLPHYGYPAGNAGDKAWHIGRERIDWFRKPLAECGANELWRGELDIELSILDSLTEKIDSVIKRLEEIGKNDPRIIRLRTIPGVGPRTAEILVAGIHAPQSLAQGSWCCGNPKSRPLKLVGLIWYPKADLPHVLHLQILATELPA